MRACGCNDMGRHRDGCPEASRRDFRERDREVHRRRREERRAAGLCVMCPVGQERPAVGGTVRCELHARRAAELQRERKPRPDGWVVLDELEPLRTLRTMAGLSLTEAARLAGLRGPSSVQGLEQMEGGPEGGSTTIGTLRKRANAWGYEFRLQVRRTGRTRPRSATARDGADRSGVPTERQREILAAVERTGSRASAARLLGITRQAVTYAISRSSAAAQRRR